MTGFGIVLYGPPASGKSTVTRELHTLDQHFSLFKRLKSGAGRTEEYRMVPETEIDELRLRGEVVWENQRYGAVYVIDRPSLATALENGVPVVHVGQPEAVKAIREVQGNWLVVSLWCPRDLAVSRIRARATGDIAEREQAWDSTPALLEADLSINTDDVAPTEAAHLILAAHRQQAAHVRSKGASR